MPLPTFLLIGSMKSGTTSLWGYLHDHPEVFVPEEKEPDFFVAGIAWERGLDWYESLFDGAEHAKARGEASTNYTKAHRFRGVPERIASILPDVKLIYVMRNPIERMISHYLHLRATAQENLPIERAFVEHRTYLETSRYAFQLGGYLERFPRERLLLMTAEELRDDPIESRTRVYSFLGVDTAPASDEAALALHASAKKPIRSLTASRAERTATFDFVRRLSPLPVKRLYNRLSTKRLTVKDVSISDALRARLTEELRPEIEALRALMGDGFDGWGLA